jgi:hypothetical protein
MKLNYRLVRRIRNSYVLINYFNFKKNILLIWKIFLIIKLNMIPGLIFFRIV